MKTAHLYLVVFPEKRVLKVGKAVDVVRRLAALRHSWGEPDYAQSYCLEANEALVHKFEKGLHGLLVQHRVFCGPGDGATELFSLPALDIALAHLGLVMEHTKHGELALCKGITLPEVLVKARLKRAQRVLRRLDADTDATLDTMASSLHKLRYLKRVLMFLARREDKVEYQWDFRGGQYVFRVRNAAFFHSDYSGLFSSLSFNFQNLTAIRGRNHCFMIGRGDITQFELDFRLPAEDDVDPSNFLAFVTAQIQSWMEQLPRRSAAVTQEIPILEAHWSGRGPFDGPDGGDGSDQPEVA